MIYRLVFGETAEEHKGNEENDPEICPDCVVKDLEMQNLQVRHNKEMERTTEWYESEADKAKQIFLKRIDSLTKENLSLKAKLSKAKEPQIKEKPRHLRPLPATSSVTQALSAIVGELCKIFSA